MNLPKDLVKDLENQLNPKGVSITDGKVGKELAEEMLSHVSGGVQDTYWIKASWTLRF